MVAKIGKTIIKDILPEKKKGEDYLLGIYIIHDNKITVFHTEEINYQDLLTNNEINKLGKLNLNFKYTFQFIFSKKIIKEMNMELFNSIKMKRENRFQIYVSIVSNLDKKLLSKKITKEYIMKNNNKTIDNHIDPHDQKMQTLGHED